MIMSVQQATEQMINAINRITSPRERKNAMCAYINLLGAMQKRLTEIRGHIADEKGAQV